MNREASNRRRAKVRSLSAVVVFSMAALTACEDDPVTPVAEADIAVDVQSVAFAETDVQLGSTETLSVTVMNAGSNTLNVSATNLGGADAGEFAVVAGGGGFALSANQSRTIDLGFMPASVGTKTASLTLVSDDPDEPNIVVSLAGVASVFEFVQVDRVGIPVLNTVFNHPSGIAGFDKTAYNIASPAGDVATYTAQFETVLNAVGNADPAATAALLLPDELPVSLAAAPTAFASLTGRRLEDDATDVALSVTVGAASLQSDNVDANDKPFLTVFPYLAEPN